MHGKKKRVVQVFILLIVISAVFSPLYSALNYYPTIENMEEDIPPYSLKNITICKIGQLWAISQNQRITMHTEVPAIPTDRFPIFTGKASSNVLHIDFVDSIKDCNSSNEGICFLINNHDITKAKIDAGNLHTIEQAKIDNSNEYIIHQLKNGNFVPDTGNYPMSPLGRVKIMDMELVYFDLFDYYPYEYEGETTYYPAWKITAKTSNYGDEIIMIKAMSSTANE
ncbi:MAG: hypothetical protein RBT65_11170 [Methanolobus sp.]|nr:hypothetical protein [Methanolobus sp.]